MTTAGSIKRIEDDLAAGTSIGRYRIEDPVGRGGMGTVYQAFDSTTNRVVALKLLAKGIPATLRERFLAECEAEANIRHEHVMPVYDRGWLTDDQPYFVMELLYEPITLTELVEHIQHGTLGSAHPRLRHWNDQRRLIQDVVLPIIEGVDVANDEYGVQHRDLKPDNVLIDIRTKRAYLIDFGICRQIGDTTDIGKIVGTPRYLSPEQAKANVDPRTDVWGCGALLRFLVTGEPPIRATSPFTRADVAKRIDALKQAEAEAANAGEGAKARGYAGRRAQLEDPALRVTDDLFEDAKNGVYEPLPENTSAGLAAIINKAMAPASADRYDTAGDLARDLRTWVKGGGVQALSEAGRGGAVVDFARRYLNRNVVRGAGALTTLFLGFLFGTGLFTKIPPQPDFRFDDAMADLGRINAAKRSLNDRGVGAIEAMVGLARLAREAEAIGTRANGAAPEKSEEVRIKLNEINQTAGKRGVVFEGWSGGPWHVDDYWKRRVAGGPNKAGRLPPGAYVVESSDKRFRARVGLAPDPNDRAKVFRFVGATDIPSGMRWVPAGTADAARTTTIPPFLAGGRLVANEDFAEWLDDMPAAERSANVPAQGFQKDPRDPTRWLVVRETASQPVRGVSPAAAAAYADWRSKAFGITLQVASDTQWRRMAGIDQFGAGSDLVFPWQGAPQWRMRHRAGRTITNPSRRTRELNHESPFGFTGLFDGPGEIVRSDDGEGFVVKGKGGIVPMTSSLLRSASIEKDDRNHGYGFRLVYQP